jgi:hypothetical protein
MPSKYSFETAPKTYEWKDSAVGNRRHRRGDDGSVGSGSLTYSSAASSIHSATGESTDSSFAEIMRVLDGESSTGKDIAMYLQQHHQQQSRLQRGDEKSVAESLAYSTDAESHMMRSLKSDGESTHLVGFDLISTITG